MIKLLKYGKLYSHENIILIIKSFYLVTVFNLININVKYDYTYYNILANEIFNYFLYENHLLFA